MGEGHPPQEGRGRGCGSKKFSNFVIQSTSFLRRTLMSHSISRRDFLKVGGVAAAVFAAGSFLPPQVAKAAKDAVLSK